MKKISQVILKILVIILLIQFTSVPLCHAGFWGDIFQAGDSFLEEGKNSGGADMINGGKVKIEFNKIYNILFNIW